MSRTFEWQVRRWPLREPFVTSRGPMTEAAGLYVRITDPEGRVGHGEACPVEYAGETVARMLDTAGALAGPVRSGATRDELRTLAPAGGARAAVDAALWDLEAKITGIDPFLRAGLEARRVVSTSTISVGPPEACERAARRLAGHVTLKVKVDGRAPLEQLAAVRRGAPRSALIVDPNQAWTVEELKAWMPELVTLGVVLIEQPIPVGDEAGLDGYVAPVPLCADELIDDVGDLARAFGRFACVNIKLEKSGGLTAALHLADAAQAAGFGLMVGCMAGSSLAMAPGMVLAQRCLWVDLDAPVLQTDDCPHGFEYRDGVVETPWNPRLWG
jgi:L-alanine-DL-glutamate epimerase-like enolase superfamily enzyme